MSSSSEEETYSTPVLTHASSSVEPSDDELSCCAWLTSLMKLSVDTISEELSPKQHQILLQFVRGKYTTLYFYKLNQRRMLTPEPPTRIHSEILYFIAITSPLTPENITRSVQYGSVMGSSAMSSLLQLMSSIYVPSVTSNRTWPEVMRKEFLGQLHRFMAVLTETVYQSQGKTVLFIPSEEISNPEESSKQKDLVQRLEAIVIYWTKQIQDVVSSQEMVEASDSLGPLAEMEFWKGRVEDLEGIRQQLEQEEVLNIISVLEHSLSTYLQGFKSLAEVIKLKYQEAKNNLVFLTTLSDPCEKLSRATLPQILDLLPILITRVRLIWEYSAFYCSSKRISGLLRRVTNDVISRCRDVIDLRDLFGLCLSSSSVVFDQDKRKGLSLETEGIKSVEKLVKSLTSTIEINQRWQDLFSHTVNGIESDVKKGTKRNIQQYGRDSNLWDFDPAPIFAQVHAFIQRCNDLVDACQYYIQFTACSRMKADKESIVPTFGGTRGEFIENSLVNIEQSFMTELEKLSSLSMVALDVRETKWYEGFASFKSSVKELEVVFLNTANSAFEEVSTVADSVSLLNAFHYIAYRDSVKRLMERKIAFVFQLFQTEIANVRKEFEQFRHDPVFPFYMPKYSGSASWAKNLLDRLSFSFKALELLPNVDLIVKDAVEARQNFSYLTSMISDFIQSTFTEWKEVVASPSLPLKFDLFLFKKSEDDDLIESSFDTSLLQHFSEIYFWNLLQFDIPFVASSLVRHSKHLKIVLENVLMVVRKYNGIKKRLDDNNKRLLSERIQIIDRKLQPGFEKFTWLSRNALDFLYDAFAVCSDTFSVVSSFESINNQISAVCNDISNCSGIVIKRKKLYTYSTFKSTQLEAKENCLTQLKGHYTTITSLIEQLKSFFNTDSDFILNEWNLYVSNIDNLIIRSLIEMIKNSLLVLSNALKISSIDDGNNSDVPPVFSIYSLLKNEMLLFDPVLEDLTSLVGLTCNGLVELTENLPKLCQIDENSGSYYSDLAPNTEISSLSNAILSAVESIASDIAQYTNHWDQKYGSLWKNNSELYFETFDDLVSEMENLDNQIRNFKHLQSQIQAEDTVSTLRFIHVDSSKLKYSLVHLCESKISILSAKINSIAYNRLTEIFEFFNDKLAILSKRPTSLEMLSSSMSELEVVRSKLEVIEGSFNPLRQIYELLSRHGVTPSENEQDLLNNLQNEWVSFNAQLQSIESMLTQSRVRFRESLTDDLNLHKKAIVNFRSVFEQKAPFSRNSVNDPKEAFDLIHDFRSQLGCHVDKESALRKSLQMFEVEVEDFTEVNDTLKDLDHLEEIWSLELEWANLWEDWKTKPFESLVTEDMEIVLGQLHKRLYKLGKIIKNWGVWVYVKEKVDEFKKILPLITDLRNPALRERHWKRLQKQSGHSFDPHDDDFTLQKVFSIGLHQMIDEISALSTAASQELAIENTLNQISKTWTDLKVETAKYKSDFYRLKSIDDVNNSLEDNNVTLSTMKGSKYVTAFLRHVEEWDKTLNTIMETFDLWLLVQRQWLYMESIFSSGDAIARQLPDEARLFSKVNSNWKFLMNRFINEHHCLALKGTHVDGLFELLTEMNEELERIQKRLDDYLETKRMVFPRFYFLSNDDLLEILGQSKDPSSVNKHLKKFFMAVSHLQFLPPGKDGRRFHEVQGMWSLENEYLKFANPTMADGPVEEWLCDVERSMQLSLQKYLRDCLSQLRPNALKREKWIQNWHGQLIITAGQLLWTADVTRALQELDNGGNPNALKILRKRQVMLLNRMTAMVRGDLSSLNRLKLIALITIEVHARDVIQKLITSGTKSPHEFEWTSQLRYYLEDELCTVVQNTSVLGYGYEYIGNSGRLVITPLTDRCYMTLTTALEYKRGGSPQGPAGTGKTETVKDLAKALALNGIVFNCSDDFDYKSMGRIFLGLVQTGSWGCFDEFNRIDIEVLSVVAQQILCILSAVAKNAETFVFEGKTIPLKPSVGIFITMNPGYAGRTELPDNLKSLFRPVAMMKPDLALIAEVELFAEGFTSAKLLSRKLTTLYSLASQQLSKQDHYDFGMRAVKAVLRAAGHLKRNNITMSEDVLMLKALYDSNIPKLVAEDSILFKSLLGDLFPGVELEANKHEELISALENSLESEGLQKNSVVINKAIQLFETKQVRHGVMIVGLTSAKSTIWKTLKSALTSLNNRGVEKDGFDHVHTHVINPKTVELYGYSDLATNEWKDGVLSLILRKVSADTRKDQQWIVFDGPVDTIWIESMNTVLDDSKVLTLVNSERIAFPSTVSFLFETRDLSVASPATVSRVGIVYVDVNDVGYEPFLESWMDTKRKNVPMIVSILQKLFAKYITKAFDLLYSEWEQVVCCTKLNLIQSFCSLFDSLVTDDFVNDLKNPDGISSIIELYFVFALTWSVGASLTVTSRSLYDMFVRDIEPRYPSKGTVFDYFVDLKKQGFTHWEEKIPSNWKPSSNAHFHDIIVPTMDTLRNSFLLNKLILNNRSVLVTGETGTGKTILVKSCLNELPEDLNFGKLEISFSARTTTEQFQRMVESRLDKRTSGNYIPKGCSKMALFIDEFNMPAKTEFGSMPPLELVRQYLDYGGWYDLDKQFFKYVHNVQLISAMGIPGGGRQVICDRLSSRLHCLNVTFPDRATIIRIFGSLFSFHTATFEQEVLSLSDSFASSTLDLFDHLASSLLPTPAKSHYLFNLRDISRIFQGLCRSNSSFTKEGIVKLWVHECLRVFADRLVDQEDRQKVVDFINNELIDKFGSSWKRICSKAGNPPLFSSFAVEENYTECPALPQLREIVEEKLEDYNQENKIPLNLVMFKDAIDHLIRIHRILTTRRGNLMLVGVGGSGRQSLAKLASFIAGYHVFQIEIKKNYRVNEWHQDLQKLYYKCGVLNQPTTFIFSDTQVVLESFLEDVNNILSTGETPNMYSAEELVALRDELRPIFRKEVSGLLETDDGLWNFFINRVRQNLHLVLCLSPIGQDFRLRVRQYPAFVSTTTIDWFNAWPEDALKEVALHFIQELDDLDEELKPQLADVFVHCHLSVIEMSNKMQLTLKRSNFVTPTSYLEHISEFSSLIKKKKNDLNSVINKLSNGLVKLENTKKEVQTMSLQLDKTREVLKVKQAECADLLQTIVKKKQVSDEQAKSVREDSVKLGMEQEKIEAEATKAEAELNAVLPALERAKEALNALTKNAIGEVRTFSQPPPLVKLVLSAVMVLRKAVDTSWGTAKQHMSNPNFLQELINFDLDSLSDSILKKLAKFTSQEGFNPDVIRNVSVAATSLCQWVLAMEEYGKANKVVAPRKAALESAQKKLSAKQLALQTKQKQLDEINAVVEKLNNEYEESEATKIKLSEEAEFTELKLERAASLVSGLSGEKERWEAQITELNEQLRTLPGDCVIASAFLAYGGVFTSELRAELLDSWVTRVSQSIPTKEPFTSLIDYLGKATDLRSWSIQGLPSDQFSQENGILVTQSSRWPLMIDPQGQANQWIKQLEKDNGLKIINLRNSDFLKILESAVMYGTPILLEDVGEELDPTLDPLLSKAFQKVGNKLMLKLGDSDVEFNPNFRFYITTKLQNPTYTPEISTKTSLVNFAVKEKGLEDQLLGIVVRTEIPDIEIKRNDLVMDMAAKKNQMVELEDEILDLLSASENILEDSKLINTLKRSKVTSEEIKNSLEAAAVTEKQINEMREQYRPVAQRASLLFFVLDDISRVDPMYQFSLDAYVTLFETSIQKAKKMEKIEDRVNEIINFHSLAVYKFTCRGLFEKDKLLFSFQMCSKILLYENRLDNDEYQFLLRGGSVLDRSRQIPNPFPSWIPSQNWDNITEVEKLSSFRGLVGHVEDNEKLWHYWYSHSTPEKATLPAEWETKLNIAQKLILVRCLRPDRLLLAIRDFVASSIGSEFTEPPPFNLNEAFNDSKSTIPIIFILSPGVDPTSMVVQLAEQKGFDGQLATVALGQGQSGFATSAIEKAVVEGGWVLLMNCHLSISWLPELEKIILTLPSRKPHDQFRLWLTSDPHPKFPISVLQIAVKLTTEPPKGLKQNMLRVFNSYPPEHFKRCKNPVMYRRLFFALAFFHSVLIERRKFKALGWNIPYDFNFSDLDISEKLLVSYIDSAFVNDNGQVNWTALRYLTGEACYAGRVTEFFDIITLNTYMKAFYNPEVAEVPNYKFFGSEIYYVPDTSNIEAIIEYINSLPMSEPASIFGQHPNADIASAIQESHQLLDTVISLQPRIVSVGEESREAVVLRMVSKLKTQIPALIDYEMVQKSVGDDLTPLNTVLLQEVSRYNVLLSKIHHQLSQLEAGINGTIVISKELEDIFEAIFNGNVPVSWSFAYPSLRKLASWTLDLIERIAQLRSWAEGSAPRVFWLGGFTYPSQFLTCLLQASARANGVPVDALSFEFTVLTQSAEEITSHPSEGAYIRGLYLEGARWNREDSCLAEPLPMILFDEMPIVHFKPVENKKKPSKSMYQAPLYIYPERAGTIQRGSYVTTVDLKCGYNATPDTYTLMGTALLLCKEYS
ncbi:hypothetical protein P9112_014095 [Eukaryota sp. TZLM1-RC]